MSDEGELLIPEAMYFILLEDKHGNHVEIPLRYEPAIQRGSRANTVRITGLELTVKGLSRRQTNGKYNTILLDQGRATLVSKP